MQSGETISRRCPSRRLHLRLRTFRGLISYRTRQLHLHLIRPVRPIRINRLKYYLRTIYPIRRISKLRRPIRGLYLTFPHTPLSIPRVLLRRINRRRLPRLLQVIIRRPISTRILSPIRTTTNRRLMQRHPLIRRFQVHHPTLLRHLRIPLMTHLRLQINPYRLIRHHSFLQCCFPYQEVI